VKHVVHCCNTENQVQHEYNAHRDADEDRVSEFPLYMLELTFFLRFFQFSFVDMFDNLIISEVADPRKHKSHQDDPQRYRIGEHVSLRVANLLEYRNRTRMESQPKHLMLPVALDVVKPEDRAHPVQEYGSDRRQLHIDQL